ncbi:MAG: type II secretion system F family protein [Verrucomicrobiota bacterium]
MATFYYEAVGPGGRSRTGTLTAENRSAALRDLTERGLHPFVLKAGKDGSGTGKKPKSAEEPKKEATMAKAPIPLRSRQVVEFTEELSDLIEAGVQLEPALQSMAERQEASAVKDVSMRLRDQLREGVSFAEALRQVSPSFDPLYCALVHAGEVSGSLGEILHRQVDHLKKIQELRAKVLVAMIYPAFLMVSGVLVAILFSTYLIPKLSILLESTGAELPLLARWMMASSDFLRNYGLWCLLFGILAGIVGWQWAKSESVRPWWDEKKLQLPLFGNLLRTKFFVLFLETLGSVVQNGLPLLRGLQLMEKATSNLSLRKQVGEVAIEVADGRSLSRALAKRDVFPPSLTDILRVGEQTGRMGETLEKAGRRYDKELSKAIDRLSAMIQPAVILVMAISVGALAYIMITVIYDTISTLK